MKKPKHSQCPENFAKTVLSYNGTQSMAPERNKTKILFLCTGNACRSQIAEGWARHLKGDLLEVYSAGIYPSSVNTRAIEVMREAGVDISGHRSKHVNELAGVDFDYIVTLCDNVTEQCPQFSTKARRVHRSFQDPSFMPGTPQEVAVAFRRLRDQIRSFVETLPG